MAHFAEIDDNGIVKRVVVVGNDVPANGGILEDNDMHIDGEKWCISFFKGNVWKQTSFNYNFRKQYAGVGYSYDPSKNKFIGIKPFPSWGLNSDDEWEAPISHPSDSKSYNWNEATENWDEV